MKRKAFTNLKRKLNVCLDTAYFVKNWKLKIIKKIISATLFTLLTL